MGQRYEGLIQGGYGVGVQVMSDPVLIAKMAHHFSTFRPVPGTLNVLLPGPFDAKLFTGRITSDELGGHIEDHPYAPVVIEGTIPGLVIQTLNPTGDQPPELVELIADRHLRTALGLTDGARIAFELT